MIKLIKMGKLNVYTEKFMVYISKEQKEKIRKIAEKKLIPMSDVARIAINEYLENHKDEINENQH